VSLSAASVLIVGVGGLGSPAARVLARSGVGSLTLLDDDCVDASNLHRQVLFEAEDVGLPKVEVAARRLQRAAEEVGHRLEVRTLPDRLLPENALDTVAGHDLVLEGADNLPTKFLTADACALARVPCVQGGAVRWSGWALGHLPGRGACLRCVFEDVPRDRVETCAEAGVVGPVVGVLGALEGALALRLLGGDETASGELWSYLGLEGTLRRSRIRPRPGCPLCSGAIQDLRRERYAPVCAA